MRMLVAALTAGVLLGAASSRAAAVQDESTGTEGIVITVTTVSDEVNGDVVDTRYTSDSQSTFARLSARPGPDGISLREAIEVTNQDPGRYTIVFAPELAGRTISATSLPHLRSGGVTIKGDVDGDGEPDITIKAASPADRLSALHVSSGDNTLASLALIGWETGISLQARDTNTNATYANTTLVNLDIREARNGILLNAPTMTCSETSGTCQSQVRETQTLWLGTRIAENRIEASHAGISLGLDYTIGDVVDGLVIEGNEIRTTIRCPVDCPEAGTGIRLGAGFWDGSTGNQFTNVVIADNTITESAIGVVLSTGAVGASGNLISGVRIDNNTIELGGNDVLSGGIAIIAADASTAWNDPTYTPVAHPDDNHIRDIEIVHNTVAWGGDVGIQVQGGSPGSHNTVESVLIADNELIGDRAWAGIAIQTGAGSDSPDDYSQSVKNQIREVTIEDNLIRIAGTTPQDLSGAIVLSAGEALSVEHQLHDMTLSGNDIETSLPGILLRGGGHDTIANEITSVELVCNRIIGRPEILLIGGQGPTASGNLIEDVVLNGNLTGDGINDVLSEPNTQGATGNEVQWTAADDIPDGCPLAMPPSPSTEPTATNATTADLDAAEGEVDNPESPWNWIASVAGGVVAFAVGWLLLARRQRSLGNGDTSSTTRTPDAHNGR